MTQPVIVGAGTQRYMSGPDTCAQKADIYRCKRSVLTRRIRLFLGQSYGYELLLKLLCFITQQSFHCGRMQYVIPVYTFLENNFDICLSV